MGIYGKKISMEKKKMSRKKRGGLLGMKMPDVEAMKNRAMEEANKLKGNIDANIQTAKNNVNAIKDKGQSMASNAKMAAEQRAASFQAASAARASELQGSSPAEEIKKGIPDVANMGKKAASNVMAIPGF